MNISIERLLNLNNPNIIDLRPKEKYNNNHIPGSINVPADLLSLNPSKYLDKDKVYYLYCQRGITSKNACIVLNARGYNVINVIGGYEAYILK